MLQCTALSCLNWGGMALKLPVPVALSQLSVDNYNVAFRLQLQLQLFAGKALPFQAVGIFKNSTVARMTEWEGTLLGLSHAQRDEFTGFPCLQALASPFWSLKSWRLQARAFRWLVYYLDLLSILSVCWEAIASVKTDQNGVYCIQHCSKRQTNIDQGGSTHSWEGQACWCFPKPGRRMKPFLFERRSQNFFDCRVLVTHYLSTAFLSQETTVYVDITWTWDSTISPSHVGTQIWQDPKCTAPCSSVHERQQVWQGRSRNVPKKRDKNAWRCKTMQSAPLLEMAPCSSPNQISKRITEVQWPSWHPFSSLPERITSKIWFSDCSDSKMICRICAVSTFAAFGCLWYIKLLKQIGFGQLKLREESKSVIDPPYMFNLEDD